MKKLKLESHEIESAISFTREDYEKSRKASKKELVDFDDFIENVKIATIENNGSIEDAAFIAEDAFNKL